MTEMTNEHVTQWDPVSSLIGDTISLEDGPDENGAFMIKEEQFNNLVNLVIEMRRAESDRAYNEAAAERLKLKGYVDLLRNRIGIARGVLSEAGELFQDRLNTLDITLRRTADY